MFEFYRYFLVDFHEIFAGGFECRAVGKKYCLDSPRDAAMGGTLERALLDEARIDLLHGADLMV